jgi:hypothetical protein
MLFFFHFRWVTNEFYNLFYRNRTTSMAVARIQILQQRVLHIPTDYLCPSKRRLREDGQLIDEPHAEQYFVSLDDVVQAMREDLSIVCGNVRDMLAAFILVPFDHHGLLRTPNTAA